MENRCQGGIQPAQVTQQVGDKSGLKPRPLLVLLRDRSGRDEHTAAAFGSPRLAAEPAFSLGFGVQAGLPALRAAASPAALLGRPVRALAEVVPVHELGLWLPPLVPPLLGWPSLVS